MLYEVDGRMKYERSNGRKHTHKECKDKRKLPVRNVLHSPFYDLIDFHPFSLDYLEFPGNSSFLGILIPYHRNLTIACKLDDA